MAILFLHVVLLLLCVLQHTDRAHSAEAKCSKLGQCTCDVYPDGLKIQCHGEENAVRQDITKLQGEHIINAFISAVPLKHISAFYFNKMTITNLALIHCRLGSLHDDAFAGMGPMEMLDLSSNRLTTIPTALRAIRSLRVLDLSNNRIKVMDDGLDHLAFSLEQLTMNQNLIERVRAETFNNFTRLEWVHISRNKIRNIPRGLFSGATALYIVDMSANFIENADPLLELGSLQTLYLSKNHIKSAPGISGRPPSSSRRKIFLDNNPIAHISFSNYYDLSILNVENCNASSVGPDSFANSPFLVELNLSKNNISFIPGSCFHNDSELKQLKANDNSITTIEGTFNFTRQLQSICLSFNKIRDIRNAFTGLRELETLKLDRNEIEFIADETFGTNEKMKLLSLVANKIKWLGKHAFRGLLSLHKLLLDSNQLVILNCSLSYMPYLRDLSLNYNLLVEIGKSGFLRAPRLRYIRANGNNISDIRGAFTQLKELNSILLEGNRLQWVHRASFPASLASLHKIALQGNELYCDCQLEWLLDVTNNGTSIGNLTCTSPPWLKGLSLLDVTANMLHESPKDCDTRCRCTCRADHQYGKSTYVDCSAASLTQTPEIFPNDSKLIDLKGNSLRTLGSTLAIRAPHTETLILSGNSLSSLSAAEVPRGLKNLDLRNNSFTRFPIAVVAVLNLTTLWLSGNKWICDCESYNFTLWAQVNEGTIQDGSKVICAEGSIPQLYGKPFVTLELKDLCLPAIPKIVFAIPLTVLLIIILCITLLYLKHEQQVKVWLFSRGLLCVQENDVDKDKVFDAFLSFSSKDADWAYANLVSRLEQEGFSICTYEKNFKGGFFLQDIIQEAVSCSCRTLLLLTQNFVDSEWCRWEFRLAHRNALQDRINRLVIVVKEEIPDNVDNELLAYIKATKYLRWGERHFWEELKYSLPRRDGASAPHADNIPLSIIPAGQIP